MIAELSRLALLVGDGGVGDDLPGGLFGDNPFISTFLMMGALVAAMYFFMIRPESKRKKAANKMREELIVGDEVTTLAGIVGRVVSIKDDTVVVETGGDKTRLTFVKGAISSRTEKISS
ncbi:MAG: preprotein translocase subunit YajC [Oscillospiraceae bacterium]|nr:preprotein translocase subunit YajC [Oscillospiraceae bacterium]